MKRYEYKCIRIVNQPAEIVERDLNRLGDEGYELRATEKGLYVFIRAIDGRTRKRKLLSHKAPLRASKEIV